MPTLAYQNVSCDVSDCKSTVSFTPSISDCLFGSGSSANEVMLCRIIGASHCTTGGMMLQLLVSLKL